MGSYFSDDEITSIAANAARTPEGIKFLNWIARDNSGVPDEDLKKIGKLYQDEKKVATVESQYGGQPLESKGWIGEAVDGLKRGVDNLQGSAATLFEGSVPLNDEDTAIGRFVQKQGKEAAEILPSREVVLGDKVHEAISKGMQSVPLSFGTSAAGFVAGSALSGGNPIVGALTAGGMTGALMYKPAKQQFVRQVRDALKEQYNVTPEQWDYIQNQIEDAAQKTGIYEVTGEGVSEFFEYLIFRMPIGKIAKPLAGIIGKTKADKILGSTLASIVAKGTGTVAAENIGEGFTQEGQTAALSEVPYTQHLAPGYNKEDPYLSRLATGIKDVAGATTVASLVQAGGLGLTSNVLTNLESNRLGNLSNEDVLKRIGILEAQATKGVKLTPKQEANLNVYKSLITERTKQPKAELTKEQGLENLKKAVENGQDIAGVEDTPLGKELGITKEDVEMIANPESMAAPIEEVRNEPAPLNPMERLKAQNEIAKVQELSAYKANQPAQEILQPENPLAPETSLGTLPAEASSVSPKAPEQAPVNEVKPAVEDVKPEAKAPDILQGAEKGKEPDENTFIVDTAYHGTSSKHAKNIRAKGFLPADKHGMPTATVQPNGISLTIDPKIAKPFSEAVSNFTKGSKPEVLEVDTSKLKIYNDPIDDWAGYNEYNDFIKAIKDKGYDAVRTDTGESEIYVFNIDKLKLKSEKKPSTPTAPKPNKPTSLNDATKDFSEKTGEGKVEIGAEKVESWERGISQERAEEIVGKKDPAASELRNSFEKMTLDEKKIVIRNVENEIKEWEADKKTNYEIRKTVPADSKSIYTDKIKSAKDIIENKTQTLKNMKAKLAESAPKEGTKTDFSPIKNEGEKDVGNIPAKSEDAHTITTTNDALRYIERSGTWGFGKAIPEGTARIVGAITREREVVRSVARAFGIKAIFVKSSKEFPFKFNGITFQGIPNTIFVSADPIGSNMLSIAGHETLHVLKNNYPALYSFLSRNLILMANEDVGGAFADAMLRYNKSGLPQDGQMDILSEFAGDFVGDQFVNKSFWDKLYDKSPQLTKDLLKVIKGIIDKIVSKIRVFKSERYFKDVNQAQELLAGVMAEFSKRQAKGVEVENTAGGIGVDYSPSISPITPNMTSKLMNILSGGVDAAFNNTGIIYPSNDSKDLYKGVRWLQTMYDLARNYPEMKGLLDVQTKRQADSHAMTLADRELTKPFYELNKESRKKVGEVLFKGDEMGRAFTDSELKTQFELNPEEISGYKAIRQTLDRKLDVHIRQLLENASTGMIKITQEMIEAVKTSGNNKDFTERLIKLGMNEKDIERVTWMLKWSKSLKGYMPHKWDSKWLVKITLPQGKEYLLQIPTIKGSILPTRGMRHSAAQNATTGIINKELGLDIDTIKKYNREGRIELVRATDLPVDLFQGARLDVLQSIVNEARERMYKDYAKDLDSETLDKLDTMKKSLGTYLEEMYLAKGFGRHLMGRRGVLGYRKDTENVIAEYLVGANSFLSKGKASKEFAKAFGKISPKKTPLMWQHGKEYISDMLGESNEAGWFKKIAGTYFLAADLSAAALNLTQNFTHAVPMMRAIDAPGGKTAEMEIMAAMKDVAGDYIESKKTDRLLFTEANKFISKDEIDFMHRLKSEGNLDPQYLGEMSGLHTNKIWENYAQQGWSMLFHLFTGAEGLNRTSTALAVYRRAIKAGMTSQEAEAKAVDIINSAHGLYGRGNRPLLVRRLGAIGNIGFTFMAYPVNNLVYLKHRTEELLSAIHTGDKVAIKQSMKVIGSNLGYLFALGGVLGLPFAYLGQIAFDIFDDDEDDWEILMRKYISRDMGRAVSRGLPAAIIGNDFSWRVQGTDVIGVPIGFQIMGMAKKRAEKAQKLWKQDRMADAIFALMPDMFRNPYAAAMGYYEGAQKEGRAPIKYTVGETITKGLGFTPTREAEAFKVGEVVNKKKAMRQGKINDWSERYLVASTKKDARALDKIRMELVEFNKAQKEKKAFGITIGMSDIIQSAQRKKKTREKGYLERRPEYMGGYQKGAEKALGLQ